MEYSFKDSYVKTMFTLTVSETFQLKVGWYCDPDSGLQGAEGLSAFVGIP